MELDIYESYSSVKSKYLSNFSVRVVFRYAWRDVTTPTYRFRSSIFRYNGEKKRASPSSRVYKLPESSGGSDLGPHQSQHFIQTLWKWAVILPTQCPIPLLGRINSALCGWMSHCTILPLEMPGMRLLSLPLQFLNIDIRRETVSGSAASARQLRYLFLTRKMTTRSTRSFVNYVSTSCAQSA